MQLTSEVKTGREKKKNIREEIWDLLVSKGYEVSSHSSVILKKEFEVNRTDHSTGKPMKTVFVRKYRFGKNNLQKFTGSIKGWSIPFCRLVVREGKIAKK